MMRREEIREYATGSLWVLPGVSAVVALGLGSGLSQISVGPDSAWGWLAFQGTADDARSLLSNVTATVVTVIALVLGLTVVALQLSSTQFSPRLLRNFLRDRPNQAVLSVFVATFVYSAAGLYTVGVAGGARTEEFPRLAVTGSIVLLFASLAMVVYFADHLVHSIQVDAIGKRVERDTVSVVVAELGGAEVIEPEPPSSATPILATESGYVQTVHPEALLAVAVAHQIRIHFRPRVGEHVVAGTVLGWMWSTDPHRQAPACDVVGPSVGRAVRIGFERTLEQDAAFGIRQLVDMACKALSPAVNDPYTAVQAVDHLSVIFSKLAGRPLGDYLVADPSGTGVVVVPGRRFGDYLSTMCGLIRRYGSGEPTLSVALLRLLDNCAAVLPTDSDRWIALNREASLIAEDATRQVAQPADLVAVTTAAERLLVNIRPHL